MNNLKNLRGTVDLLPDQLIKWQNVEKIVLEQLARASINEIRTPILEMTELFIRGIGEGTDVVSKEMYTFIDRGERSCTLRPEGTASVARALIQNGMLSNHPLQKLWYMGPMFRYERPQAGRQRQFHQLGVEFIGYDSVRSDVEIIALAWDILGKLGIKELNLEINTLGDLNDRLNFQKSFLKFNLSFRSPKLFISRLSCFIPNFPKISQAKAIISTSLLTDSYPMNSTPS